MYKFTAKYENFLGEQKEKVLRFHLSTDDIRKLEFSKEGGIGEYYKSIAESKDAAKLYEVFEDLIHLSYGTISEDGDSFVKSEEEYIKFKNSPAYEVFLDYMFTSEDGASKFVMGILPQKYVNMINSDEGKKIAAEHGIDISKITK